jgi:quercetin dioxygenase-like cupin family protein
VGEGDSDERTAFVLSVIFAVGIAVGALGVQSLHAYLEPVKRAMLIKTDLAGEEGKEGGMYLTEIAPRKASGNHYHPVHEFICVLESAGRFEVEGKPPVTMQVGDAVYLGLGQVHNTTNASTTVPAKALVAHVGETGPPLFVPVGP